LYFFFPSRKKIDTLEAMKTHSRQTHSLKIPSSRWLAYAGAGAATALAGASPAEAEIHYSGRVDIAFPPDENKSVAFPLEQPGNSITFVHTVNGSMGAAADFFGANGLRSGAFVGSYPVFEYAYVLRIGQGNRNRYISEGPFVNGLGTMIKGDRHSLRWRWHGEGTGFVGFRFDNGSGKQYGWARVHMDGADSNFSFTVADYAWADPGEPIKPGQTSSSSMETPDEGSLGLLAAGAAGVAFWRQRRKRGSP
jgi:MYXO-CTERM domain-containing protein